jgi:hypothetical protein
MDQDRQGPAVLTEGSKPPHWSVVACHMPIRLEGRTRTLSGPSPAPTSNLPTPQIPVRVGLSLRPPGCRQVAALLIPSCSAAGWAAAWTCT